MVFFFVVGLSACAEQQDYDAKPKNFRDVLTVEELTSEDYVATTPVPNSYFMPVGKYGPALHHFEGTLTLPEFELKTEVLGPPGYKIGRAVFPSLPLQFFVYEDKLVPVVRDIIRTGAIFFPPDDEELHITQSDLMERTDIPTLCPHSIPGGGKIYTWTHGCRDLRTVTVNFGIWDHLAVKNGHGIILSPGRVWAEPTDQGFSRASFPFTLVSWAGGDAQNGIATFLYNEDGVSALRLQVVQETAFAMLDMWGQEPVGYQPHKVEDRLSLERKFAEELGHQLPMKRWSDLEASRPSLAPKIREMSHQQGVIESVSVAGLVVDNVIFAYPCRTRYGNYPYCREMRHSAQAASVTLGATLAMLRLAEKYGPQVFDLKISDYVDIQTYHEGWNGVTFEHALSMSTGVGFRSQELTKSLKGSSTTMQTLSVVTRSEAETSSPESPHNAGREEENHTFFKWMLQGSSDEKLSMALRVSGDFPWGPGELNHYDSTHIYILSAAMDAYLKSEEGPNSDLWNMMQAEVLEPIGVFHLPMQRTIEKDSSLGLPLMFVGLYPTIDDIAKIAQLFHSGGMHDGRQLLHAGKIAEALYLTEEIQGLSTGEFGGHYHLGFWLNPTPWWFRWSDRTSEWSKTNCRVWLPSASAFQGATTIYILPNGITAFRFADDIYFWDENLAKAAHDVRPLCRP